MKNIVLVCVAGMSTSLLVSKMRAAAQKGHYECEINAHPASEADRFIPQADIVLLGPQVKYMLGKLQKTYPDKNIDAIDMRIYGMIDGKAALEYARKLMGDE